MVSRQDESTLLSALTSGGSAAVYSLPDNLDTDGARANFMGVMMRALDVQRREMPARLTGADNVTLAMERDRCAAAFAAAAHEKAEFFKQTDESASGLAAREEALHLQKSAEARAKAIYAAATFELEERDAAVETAVKVNRGLDEAKAIAVRWLTEGSASAWQGQRRVSMDLQRRGSLDLAPKIDSDSLGQAIKMAKTTIAEGGRVAMDLFPPKLRESLSAFDTDGDGFIDPDELALASVMYEESKQKSKRLGKLLFAAVIFIFVLLGFNAAVTAAVLELSKDTNIDPADAVMRVTTSGSGPGPVVKVGSVDTSVNGSTFVTADGETVGTKQVLVPSPLTSGLPDKAFKELKQFDIKSDTGAFVSLVVQGWYRVPSAASRTGSYVKIITYAGLITLDAAEMTFSQTVGTVFTEAGFDVTGSGRRLLGMYELIGMFNSVTEWYGLDTEAGEKPPGFGKHDFIMTFETRMPCGPENSTTACYDRMFEESYHGATQEITGGDESQDEMLLGPDSDTEDTEDLGPENTTDMINDAADFATAEAEPPKNISDMYFVVTTKTYFDADSGAVMETTTNAEFPGSTLTSFKSAWQELHVQLTGGKPYYCHIADGNPGGNSFNVSGAAKISETIDPLDPTNRTIRYFVIETAVTQQQHLALNNFDLSVEYTGITKLHYWDDKATGFPVKFRLGITEMIVTSFEDTTPVRFAPASWTLPKNCRQGDPYKDWSLPSKMSVNPRRWDVRRRVAGHCVNDPTSCVNAPIGDQSQNIGYRIPETTAISTATPNTTGRHLLTDVTDKDGFCTVPYSAQYPNRVKGVLPDGCGPQCASIYGPRPGSCAYPIPDLSALGQFNMEGSWGSSDLVKTRSWVIKKGEWDPKKKEFPTILGFNLEEWVMGCGLKEISIDAQCSNYVTCRGFCHGTTTKLCQSQNNLVCGLEVEMDITQFAGPAVGFLVDLFSIEAAISATLSYTARGSILALRVAAKFGMGTYEKRRKLKFSVADVWDAGVSGVESAGDVYNGAADLVDGCIGDAAACAKDVAVAAAEAGADALEATGEFINDAIEWAGDGVEATGEFIEDVAEAIVAVIRTGVYLELYGEGSLSFETGIIKVGIGLDWKYCALGACDTGTLDIASTHAYLWRPAKVPPVFTGSIYKGYINNWIMLSASGYEATQVKLWDSDFGTADAPKCINSYMLKNDPTFPSSVPAPGYKWRGNPHVRCAYRQSWYYKKWNMRHRNCCYYNSRGRAYACGKRTPRGPYCKHIFLRRHRYGRFGFTCGALWLKYYGSNGYSNDWQKRPGQALATTVPIDGKTDSYVFYCQNGRDTKVVHLFTHIDLAGRAWVAPYKAYWTDKTTTPTGTKTDTEEFLAGGAGYPLSLDPDRGLHGLKFSVMQTVKQ